MARCLRCKAGNEWIEGDVKPEPSLCAETVERCAKVCESTKQQMRFGDMERAADICADAIRAIPADQERVCGWIPVSKRLPENERRFKQVFVASSLCQYTAYYENGQWKEAWSNRHMTGVTHWKELGPYPLAAAKSGSER